MSRGRRILCLSSAAAAHHPRHHYRLAASLAEAGFDVEMLAQPDLTPGHEDAVPIRYLPVRSSRYARIASAPLAVLRAARLRPDALYVFTLDLLPGPSSCASCPVPRSSSTTATTSTTPSC